MECQRWKGKIPLRVENPRWLEDYVEAINTPEVLACEDCCYVCFFSPSGEEE